MANQKNIRKDLGPEDRELLPDFSHSPQAAVVRADIWMTPELKEAAQALQKAWEISHDDQMGALQIRDVNLKFADEGKRARFYEALVKLAELVKSQFSSHLSAPQTQHTRNIKFERGLAEFLV